MDITTFTIEQLKALAYDQIVQLEQSKINLQAINAELQKRAKQPEQKQGE